MRRLQEEDLSQRAQSKLAGLRRLAIIVAVYLVGWFVLDLAARNPQGMLEVSLWYPPSGLSFALLLVCGARYAPAVVLTTFFQYLFLSDNVEYPIWLLLPLSVVYAAAYAGAAVLLVGWLRIDPRLVRIRDILYFVGVGCLAAPFAASTVEVIGYAVTSRIPWDDVAVNILGGAAGEATGVGVLTTLLLVTLRPFPSLWSFAPREPLKGFVSPVRREIPELVAQSILLVVTILVAYYGTERGVRLDLAYLVFLPLTWIAVRNDLARTMVCVLLINIGVILVVGETIDNINPIYIQFDLVTLTLLGLLLSGLATEQRDTAARLVREASHDRLTDSPSRALFSDALSGILSEPLTQSSSDTFAVLAVDLDRFSQVNNALGHETGDRLLVAVAGRLRAFAESFAAPADASAKDSATVRTAVGTARIGGDSFAVLIREVGPESRAGQVAERLLEELALPYEIEGREVYATASAGVVVDDKASNDTPEEPEDLLRNADTALQAAKAKGSSCYVIFDRDMSEAAERRLELGTDLRRAIERDEFVLHYQPFFSLQTNTLVGAEALVRWEHPGRGFLSPAEFIPVAEQSGLIVPLGEWVLREACRRAREWHRNASSPRLPVAVSVNVSTKQLERPGFFGEVEAVLQGTGLDPRALILEITESVLVESTGSVHETLDSLRRHGVRLAVDDFGTGYSSLSYLNRFPVDIVKIDRSFISRLSEGSSTEEKFVSGIIDLAHGQGLTVVAEGVENAFQLERLKKIGCDMVQGYFFSKPLADEKVSSLMESPE